MGWTKQQLVEEAYAELALHGYVFDLDPEELQFALRRLDGMMGMWNGKGIRLGYPLPSSPDASNLDDDSNLPDYATEATYLSLAVRIAAGKGKQLTQQTLMLAKQAYDALLSRFAMPPEQQLSSRLPSGAGNTPWRGQGPFLPDPIDTIDVGPDSPIDFT